MRRRKLDSEKEDKEIKISEEGMKKERRKGKIKERIKDR
jgi:hypothetical protein